jgi:hypothetical protein
VEVLCRCLLVVGCRLSNAVRRLPGVAFGGCCLFLVVGCWLAADRMLWLSRSLLHSVQTVATRVSMSSTTCQETGQI